MCDADRRPNEEKADAMRPMCGESLYHLSRLGQVFAQNILETFIRNALLR